MRRIKNKLSMLNKTTLLIIALISFSTTALFSQESKRDKKKQKAKTERKSKLSWINDYQAVEKIEDKWVLKTIHPDKGLVTIYESYSSRSRNKRNGLYREFYDNKNLWIDGGYENNKKTGTWKFYNDETGKVERYGNFEQGLEQGFWYTIDSEERIESKYRYTDAKLDGEYLRYDTTGTVYHRMLYAAGVEVENEILDSLTYEKLYNQVDHMPSLGDCSELTGDEAKECRDRKFLKYLYRDLKYPSIARELGIEGKAVIKFLVNKEGNIEDVKVLRGVCNVIEVECLRVIKNLPKWTPGLKNGQPIEVYFNCPFNFKLQ